MAYLIQKTEAFGTILYVAFILIFAAVSLTFYEALAGLPSILRIIFTSFAGILFFMGGLYMRHPFSQIGKVKYWLLSSTLLLGVVLYCSFTPELQSSDFAVVHQSDGRQIEDVKPSRYSVWGRAVNGYELHPSFGEAIVVSNSVEATFLLQPKEVKLLFAKPFGALFQKDGKPTISDGISAEINAFDARGNLCFSGTVSISQEDFLKDRWVEKIIRVDPGIATLKVTLGWGPPGSTPDFDSTFVGFQIPSWNKHVEFIGEIILVCAAFFMLALFIILHLTNWLSDFRLKVKSSNVIYYGIFITLGLMLLTYWSQSNTHYVYFWDYRNYWQKTEALYELFQSAEWRSAADLFRSTYASDYTMLPAVLPALLSLATGYPSRINYSLLITAIYAVPAYIAVAYLAKRLIDAKVESINEHWRGSWALASIIVIFGMPAYFGTTLYLMPDIGGVLLVVCALLSAANLVESISERGNSEKPLISNLLFRSSISLGVLFSLMFIFRRWYVFFVVGIACSLFILVLIDIFRSRSFRRVVFSRSIASAVLITFSAFPFLYWILIDWSQHFGQHDYATLYLGYKSSFTQVILSFRSLFGIVVPILCSISVVVLYHRKKNRSLLLLLIFSTIIACLLFLQIQGPGRHHFFLLMPLLGALLAGLVILLARRFGLGVVACLTLVLIVGGVLGMLPENKKYSPSIFANFIDWMPRSQKFVDGYFELSKWLLLPENENKRFCVIASSANINQDIVRELWQILPTVTKNAYDHRLILLGQVDSVNGPPAPSIRECEIFIVGSPFQTHLRPNQQYSLEIIHNDMLTGAGIGRMADRAAKIIEMGENVELRVYQAERKITDEEYADLVRRFWASK